MQQDHAGCISILLPESLLVRIVVLVFVLALTGLAASSGYEGNEIALITGAGAALMIAAVAHRPLKLMQRLR